MMEKPAWGPDIRGVTCQFEKNKLQMTRKIQDSHVSLKVYKSVCRVNSFLFSLLRTMNAFQTYFPPIRKLQVAIVITCRQTSITHYMIRSMGIGGEKVVYKLKVAATTGH